jgi:hypothetical protein
LRGGGNAACWRVAGAREGAAGALVAAGAVVLVAVFAAGVVLGTALRAIGRGLGNGTFLGVAQASPANADNPTASARHVVSAVDRNATARLDGVTAFLRGESFNRWSVKLYLIEYVDKILKYAGGPGHVCASTAAKSRPEQFQAKGDRFASKKRFKSGIWSRTKVRPARAFRRIVRPDMNGGFQ